MAIAIAFNGTAHEIDVDNVTAFLRVLRDVLGGSPTTIACFGTRGRRPWRCTWESAEHPVGIGKTGTSAIMPALAHAAFAATGQRQRPHSVSLALSRRTG